MSLRCKPGDLAVISRLANPDYGHIVTVIEIHPPGHDAWNEALGPVWKLDRFVTAIGSETGRHIQSKTLPDEALTPLRGDLTDDEMRKEMDDDYAQSFRASGAYMARATDVFKFWEEQ